MALQPCRPGRNWRAGRPWRSLVALPRPLADDKKSAGTAQRRRTKDRQPQAAKRETPAEREVQAGVPVQGPSIGEV